MPQARARNKGKANKRQQNQSGWQGEAGGRSSSGKNAAGLQQKGANARGQRGQGARSQRVNNQKNANNGPAQQRERDEYGSVRGREFTEFYESDVDQPRVGRGQSRSSSRSGYNYQEEDFEEGGQNDANIRSGRRLGQGRYDEGRVSGGGSRFDEGREFDVGPSDARDRERNTQSRGAGGRGGQYDRDALEEQGGYGPPSRGRDDQYRDGWEGRGGRRGQSQYEDEGDWERAGPGAYQGGDFQGGRSNRGRNDVDYYGASQYSQGGGRGDYRHEGPNWNQRYGNVNRVPAGVEDEEFAEEREFNGGARRQERGPRGNGGFETARGEYSNFNTGRRSGVEDSELNDYTDARLGSNARRGGQSRSNQEQSTGRKNTGRSASSSRQRRSARAGR